MGPKTIAFVILGCSILLQVFSAILFTAAGHDPWYFWCGVLAAALAFVSQGVFGQALFAAGYDAEYLRAAARMGLDLNFTPHCRIRVTRFGTTSLSAFEHDFREIPIDVTPGNGVSRIVYDTYPGKVTVTADIDDQSVTAEIHLQSSKVPLKSLPSIMLGFQRSMETLEHKLRSVNANVHSMEYGLEDVALRDARPPIEGVIVSGDGLRLARMLQEKDLKRLRTFLFANVRVT